ncbi:MAG: hypothetical protein WCX88_02200 [Patescibacteria group bacterium]
MNKRELYVKLDDFPKVLRGESFECSEKFGDVMMLGKFDAKEAPKNMSAILVGDRVKVWGKKVKRPMATVIYPMLKGQWAWHDIHVLLKNCVDVRNGNIRLRSAVEIPSSTTIT